MQQSKQKDLELIRACLGKLPPDGMLNISFTDDQNSNINDQKFHWHCISLSWGSRIRGEEDPLEIMCKNGQISRWGATYMQLKTDYFWQFWMITQAVWTDIKQEISPRIQTPGQFFQVALQRCSMHPVLLITEPYREISYTKRRKISKLLPKAISGELLPFQKRDLDHLLKEQYVLSDSELNNWCSEMLNYILAAAYKKLKKSKKNVRLKRMLEDLDSSIKTYSEHVVKMPNSDTKCSTRIRSHAFHNGKKLYATKGGSYKSLA